MGEKSDGFIPSEYQRQIFEFVQKGRGDGIVSAVAGSGKTTTLIQASRLLNTQSAIFFAFNKHIALAISEKVGAGGMVAKTIHSVGNSALYREFGKLTVDNNKYKDIIERRLLMKYPELDTQESWRSNILRARLAYTEKLVNMSRLTLSRTQEEVEQMALDRNIDPGEMDEQTQNELQFMVREVIQEGILMAKKTHIIDFTDMIFLPVFLQLKMPTYQWVFIDEAQDLNAAQRELVLRCRAPGGRMLFVGDPRQAIMAFAGADAQSYWLIKEVTSATELPLSICYRCPRTHIQLAKQIVEQIEPSPTAAEGVVTTLDYNKVVENVHEGDLLVSRTTAPLISLCIALIRNRVPARVRGRDIADMIIKRAKDIAKHGTWEEFPALIDEYRTQQIQVLSKKKHPSETQIQLVEDLCTALEACYTEFRAPSIEALCQEISSIFSDGEASVWLSTIHRAKGLEADRVFVINHDKLPFVWKNQSEEQKEQERNLQYVALTRAKEELFLVKSPPTNKS